MIYAKMGGDAGEMYMLIVEPGNLDRLKEGKPLVTPDQRFMICYTPDLAFTYERIEEARSKGALTGDELDKIILLSLARKDVPR